MLKDELARELTYGRHQILRQKRATLRYFFDYDSETDEYRLYDISLVQL